jgi:hypothetical protein
MDHEKWLQQHDEMHADHDRWMSQMQEKHRQAAELHDREMAEIRAGQAKTDTVLRRAIRLSVQEARSQRKRHQELEALMKAFLERGANGKH